MKSDVVTLQFFRHVTANYVDIGNANRMEGFDLVVKEGFTC
jgi:hypothetical protein